MDIVEPEKIKSAITGKTFDPAAGYITDADGNHYTIKEYSVDVDKSAEAVEEQSTKD